MTVDVPALLARYQQQVDAHLASYLPESSQSPLYAAMRYSLFNGGKRVRPALCYATAELIHKPTEATHRAACAVEMIHAYSLIHDDLPAMDDDDLRRGIPTCHIVYGEATAILAGDGLQALAFEVLTAPPPADQPTSNHIHLQLVQQLARAAGPLGMVGGQSLDLNAINRQLDLDELEAMHQAKTGALINASILMGALSTGKASAEDLADLERYSQAIGLAFQVKDDILDVESQTETLGKRQGADQARNKPTYTSLLGLQGAKEKLAELHQTSNNALVRFGDRGVYLRAIADFIVNRDH